MGASIRRQVLWVWILIVAMMFFSACSEEEYDSSSDNGVLLDGDTADGDLPDGDLSDGDTSDGNGNVLPDGDDGDGDTEDGDIEDGDRTDGDWTDGDQDWGGENSSDGDVADGDDNSDGDATDGDTTDGDDPDDGLPPDIMRMILEADIYQTDGERLLILNPHNGLVRVDVTDPPNASITGRLPMLEQPDKLYMVGHLALMQSMWGEESGLEEGRALSTLTLLDVDNNLPIEELDERQFEGEIVDSRWVGNVVYVVFSEHEWTDRLTGETQGRDRIRVVALTLAGNRLEIADELSLPGEGLAVTVTAEAILVSTPGDDGSFVHIVDIRDPSGELGRRGTIMASGLVRDRFKMRLERGILTIVSQSNFAGGTTFVETFDASNLDIPDPLGFISFAEGEELHATMFRGDMLYAVTYLRLPVGDDLDPDDDWPWDPEEAEDWEEECWDGCDPLWTVSLEDPAAPLLMGELIIPGWSEHLVFYDNRLFAVGYSDTWETKVSIFNVENPWRPTEQASLVIPGRVNESDPNALYDWKSFTILWSRKLMLVPVHAMSNPGTAVIAFDFDSSGAELQLMARMPAFESVRRTFMLSGYLGVLADSQLDIVDLDTPRDPAIVRHIRFSQ